MSNRIDAAPLYTTLASAVVWADQIITQDAETEPFGPGSVAGVVAAYDDVGTYIITFPVGNRPKEYVCGIAQPANTDLDARITGYDASTGELTVVIFSNTVTESMDVNTVVRDPIDTDDEVINLFCLFKL